MSTRPAGDIWWKIVRVLALFVSILFGAWKVDEHFVTRTEFRALSESVARIESSVMREEKRDQAQ